MKRHGLLVLAIAGVAATIGAILLPPIAQDPAYHDFADRRTLLGLPNLLNVISNAPFALLEFWGSASAGSRELRARFSWR